MRMRDFDAARGDFANSFALFPGNFIAQLMLTCIDSSEGAQTEAERHFAKARELEPSATLELYHARIGRFFADSALLPEMQAALDGLWV
jgi:predicted Zn-dependent protease